jgi:hypothetical protein
MGDWDDLRRYIETNYKIADGHIDAVKLVFDVDGTRTQAVWVTRLGDSGWAEIATAVCRESEITPRDALRRNATMIVGGLALHGSGIVIFRHSFPLANLKADEFEEPLRTAVEYGDALERELSGSGDLW